ncbi:MAG: DUF86 domain-containing protein [Kineosporiaceae bacterium]|nr:DUF86 domain-containing protein [Aeromicrobium sp.]
MQPEASALLWDARKAATLVTDFVSGNDWRNFEGDPMLRSAVERQFQIIGDALNKLRRVDPDTAAQIPDLARIIAFRNVLVHGYATIDNELVWEVATSRLPDLSAILRTLLEGPEG